MLKLAALLVASAAATTAVATSTDTGLELSLVGEGDRHHGRQRQARRLPLRDQPQARRRPGLRRRLGTGLDGQQGLGVQGRGHEDHLRAALHARARRRRSPTAAGDTLLGGQIMALAIDGRGAVKGCKVVAHQAR